MSEKTQVISTASGALGLGVFGAAIGSCCALPWAVSLLGVSGAVALARLSFMVPYVLFGAAALLAIAFWWAYRPLTTCADGTCSPASRRPLRWIVWTASVLVVALSAVALSDG